MFLILHALCEWPTWLGENRTPHAMISNFGKKNEGTVYIRTKYPIWPVPVTNFSTKKRVGVFLLPPGWDASPSQCYPQH